MIPQKVEELRCYQELPVWTKSSLPAGFGKKHNTKVGTWGKIRVLQGRLRYESLDEEGSLLSSVVWDPSSEIPLIEPQAWHRVEPLSEDLRMQVSFYCREEDYLYKKYRLTAPHSEVVAALEHVRVGRALDLGCGRGRNTFFLQGKGFEVDGVDRKLESIEKLQEIVKAEQLEGISARVGDLSDLVFEDCYDLVLSTVVLMFLDPAQVPGAIRAMQGATRDGGVNLVVSAIDCEEYPFSAHSLPFGFGFRPGELREYYKGWTIKKYNEDVGHLHRMDAQGNPIALRFASLIALK